MEVDESAPGKPIVGVDLHGAPVTDAGLKNLAGLQELQTLDLGSYDEVTVAGVADLQKALPKTKIIH